MKSPEELLKEFYRLPPEAMTNLYHQIGKLDYGTGLLLAVNECNQDNKEQSNHIKALIEMINEIRALEHPTKDAIEAILIKQRTYVN